MCRRASLTWVNTALLWLFMTSCAFAQTFTSTQSGSWDDGGTWGNASPGQKGQDYPANNDNVIISGGTVVTHTSKQRPTRVVIEANGELVSNDRISVRGAYINNGIHSGIGVIEMLNFSDTIAGVGSITSSGSFFVKFDRTIYPGSELTRSGGSIVCPDFGTLTNRGNLTLTASNIDGLVTSTFVNATGGSVSFGGLAMPTGRLIANAPLNTVIYAQEGAGTQVVKKAFGGYYDLVIEGNSLAGQKTITQFDTIANDLKINGSTLVLQDTNLNVGGNVTLAASGAAFDVLTNQAKLTLNGTAPQAVNGRLQLYDLVINNPAGTVGFNLDTTTIHHGLYIDLGVVAANGNLLIASDNSGDAFVAPVTGTISGDVTVQRYIGAGATGWRFMCAPVQGATLADWNDDFITSGFPGSDFPNFYFTSIMAYDETDTGHQDSGFVFPSGVGQSIPVTGGYWVWCGDFLAGTSAFTVDVSGPLNTGAIVYPITYSNNTSATADGWNLVSNPYASAIDWDSPAWVKTGVDNGVYVWNTNANSYASYVGGIGVNGGSNLIASGQAFYVKANLVTPILSINEACKSTNTATFLKGSRLEDPILRIILEGDSVFRETIIRLQDASSRDFDPDYDSYHLAFDYDQEQLYSTMNGIDLAINSIPFFGKDSLLLQVKEPDEEFSLHFQKNQAMTDLCVALRDLEDGSIHLLEGDQGTLNLQHAMNSVSRYEVILQDPFLTPNTFCQLLDATTKATIPPRTTVRVIENALEFEGPKGSHYELIDVTGRLLKSGAITDGSMTIHMPAQPAVYFLQIGRETHKVFLP